MIRGTHWAWALTSMALARTLHAAPGAVVRDEGPSPHQAAPANGAPTPDGAWKAVGDELARRRLLLAMNDLRMKNLVRRRDDRMVAGVCSGVADYLGVDVTLIRVLAVVALVFSFGAALVAYVAAWILMPEV